MKLKFVLVIGLCLCLLSGCSNENPNPKDTQVQSEQENDDAHEAWYTEKEQFELWTESTQYLQTIENPILEGFSLAEYYKCDTRYPAIYDAKYRIIFFDYHVEIQEKDTGYQLEQALPWYLSHGEIVHGNIRIKRSDVNEDGVEDLVFVTRQTGIGHNQYIEVLGLDDYEWIILDYEPIELVEHVPDFDADAYDYNYEETDFRWIEDGVIYVETLFGHNMSSYDSVKTKIAGSIVGRLVYQSETNSFVLDADSVTLQWDEDQNK